MTLVRSEIFQCEVNPRMPYHYSSMTLTTPAHHKNHLNLPAMLRPVWFEWN